MACYYFTAFAKTTNRDRAAKDSGLGEHRPQRRRERARAPSSNRVASSRTPAHTPPAHTCDVLRSQRTVFPCHGSQSAQKPAKLRYEPRGDILQHGYEYAPLNTVCCPDWSPTGTRFLPQHVEGESPVAHAALLGRRHHLGGRVLCS